ncbi:hypothetical protein NM208_g10793 [Fusarium decemcellulare]|uniref:Uncharacterized protein n=1 Tax=Fusarium decemcellulare TaxID=57161 RepID=A0ACC1RWM0_9HYPO|nr:hypothetical protein NM208_g10793 [Fusarium decemcellulare]
MRLSYTTLLASLCLGAEAKLRYCPPYGPVLPAPKRPSEHPAVKFVIEGILTTLQQQVGEFNSSAVSVGIQSIHEDAPFLDFHHTPPHPDKRGAKEVNANTVYRLGSISKVFTVLAALKLAEDGKLNMNDVVGKWIPELMGQASNDDEDELDRIRWQDVTVEALASHLSGIGGDMTTDLAAFDYDWESMGLPKASSEVQNRTCSVSEGIPACTRKDLLETFQHRRPPVYPANQSPVYSNAGISMVGLVVEVAFTKSYDAALHDLILEPLALKDTTVGTDPNKIENIFIPAGSTDWDMDLGVFDPAGGINSNTKDMLSFLTGILKKSALSPASTHRWLKPNTFTSTWSSAVGAPWEIYRIDNLTSDGRIIDIHTKGGSLTSYHGGLALVSEFGLAISVLSAGPEAPGLWPQLAMLKATEALIPALDLASRDEAKKRFAGKYTHEESGSELTLSLDDGPGLVLTKWIVRDFFVLENLNRYNPANVLKQNLDQHGEACFRLFTDEVAKIIDASTSLKDVTCNTWQTADKAIYNRFSLDHFEFQFGDDGETAVSIKLKGFDVELARVKES